MPLCLFLSLLLVGGSADAQQLRIFHIDVDQGGSTLFVSPSGQTLLVDSGKNGHGPRLREVMDEAGVSTIDFFVATHYHEDHYGGIDDLVDAGVEVLRAYDRGDKDFIPAEKRSQQTFTDYRAAVGDSAVHLMRGEIIPLDPDMLVTCIASGGVVLGEEDPVPGSTENDMSIVLLVQYGGFRYFIGGDIGDATEAKIAALDLVLDVDVYQANHHGSETSSSQPFIDDLLPTAVIISNGDHGGYQHPRQTTLDRLTGLSPRPTILQTNKYLSGGNGGNVDDAFIGDLESDETDGTILLDVRLDDSVFDVSYDDTTITFPFKRPTPPSFDVVIESVLPNPVGDEWLDEEITLRNEGRSAAAMEGWLIRDAAGRVWTLATLGALEPGESKTVRRDRMPMGLNNGSDEIVLLDPNGGERDRFAYEGTEEGARIQTGH